MQPKPGGGISLRVVSVRKQGEGAGPRKPGGAQGAAGGRVCGLHMEKCMANSNLQSDQLNEL